MARIYANLIEKYLRTFKSVPETLKEQVRQILTDDGREDLIIE